MQMWKVAAGIAVIDWDKKSALLQSMWHVSSGSSYTLTTYLLNHPNDLPWSSSSSWHEWTHYQNTTHQVWVSDCIRCCNCHFTFFELAEGVGLLHCSNQHYCIHVAHDISWMAHNMHSRQSEFSGIEWYCVYKCVSMGWMRGSVWECIRMKGW